MASPRIIVVAVDHSLESKHAFRWCLSNYVRPETDRVVAISVGPSTPLYYDYYWDVDGIAVNLPPELSDTLEQKSNEAGTRLTEELQAEAKRVGVSCEVQLLKGDPRERIIELCQAVDANVLVMGSRGLGTIKRTLLGSVSDHCVHHCHCPIIIVKMPPETPVAQPKQD